MGLKAFVYGALMDELDGEPAMAEGYAVRFTAAGIPWLEPRFLALEDAPGQTAHGVLADLEQDAYDKATSHESGYDRVQVTVRTADGEHEATALVLQSSHRAPEGRCSRRYANRLVRGARKAGLPAEVIAGYEQARSTGTWPTTVLLPLLAPTRWLAGFVGLWPAAVVVGVTLGLLGVAVASALF